MGQASLNMLLASLTRPEDGILDNDPSAYPPGYRVTEGYLDELAREGSLLATFPETYPGRHFFLAFATSGGILGPYAVAAIGSVGGSSRFAHCSRHPTDERRRPMASEKEAKARVRFGAICMLLSPIVAGIGLSISIAGAWSTVSGAPWVYAGTVIMFLSAPLFCLGFMVRHSGQWAWANRRRDKERRGGSPSHPPAGPDA